MPVTPLFAALLAIFYIYLSVDVIKHRLGYNVSLGTGGHNELERSIRAHANFIEYVPISLILLWFLETITFNHRLTFILGCVLLLARIAHVIGIQGGKKVFILRRIGVLGTFTVIVISAGMLFWSYIPVS